MKESRVARLQATYKIVNRHFECARFFDSKDCLPSFTSDLGPIDTVKVRIEVLLLNRLGSFIVDSSSLCERQLCWLRN